MQQIQEHRRRAAWLRTLHQWHWISAAICLAAMLLFSLTGLTLNHASLFEARPRVSSHSDTLPPGPLNTLARAMEKAGDSAAAASAGPPDGATAPGAGSQGPRKAPLPPDVSDWIRQQWQISTADRIAEWSEDEVFLSMPRPGGDAWLRIDPESGEIEYENTDNGWVSYFNDLHKGRHTGGAWRWFIDLVAIACLIFLITGLWIMKIHAASRPTTWPLVGFGLLLPVLLMLLLVH
ncbi:MAG: PepSY-associated TM helix domain-containing protein [Lautropia sp.]|nr:PepSY-associated TM helix domain-containing protein [Lautropia sp.]